jgi:transposase-like protein
VVEPTMDLQEWLRKQLEQASPDLLRAMVQEFAEALMSAEADALCGAPYRERSPERINRAMCVLIQTRSPSRTHRDGTRRGR